MRTSRAVGLLLLMGGLTACNVTERVETQGLNGRVEQIGSFRTLRVWGTPEEMGYAHGYLMGDEFAHVYQVSLAALSGGRAQQLDAMWHQLLPFVSMPAEARAELEAFVAGAEEAAGGPVFLEALDRELTVEDLVIYNSRDMLRGFGCSGFTVWGETAGEAGVITTRNFDFPIPGKVGVDSQFLLVRHPEGRRAVVSITWPGYIGAFTGVNDQGVCAFMHDGTGGVAGTPSRKTSPLPIALRSMLEQSDAEDATANAERSLTALGGYPFSYFARIVGPRVADGGAPVTVFRIDPQGLSRNPVGEESCVVTNHYLDASGQAAEGTNGWSLSRYEALSGYLAGGFAAETLWSALDRVARKEQDFPTLHTVVVYPEQRRLQLAFCSWNGEGVVPATAHEPREITFDELFAAPE